MDVKAEEIYEQISQFLCPMSQEFWKSILIFCILVPINEKMTNFEWFDKLFAIW